MVKLKIIFDFIQYRFLTKNSSSLSGTILQRKVSTGFTVIELLVVVAIIAVLTAIVLFNVSSYLNKGKDAAAKANLATMIVNGAVWYDTGASPTGTYNLWITGAGAGAVGYVGPYNAIVATGYAVAATCNTVNCAATALAWCACIQLKSATPTTYFCVDSTTKKSETTTACATECSQTSATPGLCL